MTLAGANVQAGELQSVKVITKRELISPPEVKIEGNCIPASEVVMSSEGTPGVYIGTYRTPGVATGCNVLVKATGEAASDHRISEFRSSFTLVPCYRRIKGDASGNGERSVADLVLILNVITGRKGPASECETLASDINCDGKVNLGDAILLLRRLVLEESLPSCTES
jgi:hypothetical protein